LKTWRALGAFACQVISGSTRVSSLSHSSMLAVGVPFHVPLGCSRTHAKRRVPVSGAGSSWLVGQKPILMTKNTDMAPPGCGLVGSFLPAVRERGAGRGCVGDFL
jgi:hypothetical protein